MVRRGLVALALACSLTAPALPAAAEDDVLVVRSDGSGSVDVDVPSRTTLYPSASPFRGGGRWALLLVEPLRADRPAPAFAVFRLPLHRDEVAWTGLPEMRAGRYRLWLVAERPVEVRLQTSAPSWRPLVARGHGKGRLLAGARTLAPGSTDHGVRLRAGRGAGAVLAMSVTGQRAEDTWLCATRDADCDRTVVTLPGGVPVDADAGPPSVTEGPFSSFASGALSGRDLVFRVRGRRTSAGALTAQAVVVSDR